MNKKEKISEKLDPRKYKLSFLDSSPTKDWLVILFFGFFLIILFSILSFFDSEKIRRDINKEDHFVEQKKYFDLEKADYLIQKIKREIVDQSH